MQQTGHIISSTLMQTPRERCIIIFTWHSLIKS